MRIQVFSGHFITFFGQADFEAHFKKKAPHTRVVHFHCVMQRFLCFASAAVLACGTMTEEASSEVLADMPAHPILNVHVAESSDAAILNDFAYRQESLEQVLDALESRAQVAENVLGNQMSIVNDQIHELVYSGTSLATARLRGGMLQQLRTSSKVAQTIGKPSEMDDQTAVQTLAAQLAFLSDKDTQPVAEVAVDTLDASGPEAVTRQHLMNAQKSFASAGNAVEHEDLQAIESKLALAMESPSQVGSPSALPSPVGVVNRCQPDENVCPRGWKGAGGSCVASSDYVGPCANELNLLGMNKEQMLAIAKYCRFEFPCK